MGFLPDTFNNWLAVNQGTGGTTTPPLAAPTLTGFLPISGAQGSTVVLTGTNLLGATQVSINSGAVASFHVDSATQITAVLSSAQATGKVRVTTPGGTAVSREDFTVTVPAGGVKLPLYLVVGNSHAYGPNGSSDSTIGTAGHEAWPNVALADLNANGAVCAFKVFAYPGHNSDDLRGYMDSDVTPWLQAHGSEYSAVYGLYQEMYNDANGHNPTYNADQVYAAFTAALAKFKTLPGMTAVSALTGYPGTSTSEPVISAVNKRLVENRNDLGLRQVFNTRTVPGAGTFSDNTVDISGFHLNEKGNKQLGDFIAYGITSGVSLIIHPDYVAPIVYNFNNPSFEKSPSGDEYHDWQRIPNSQWRINGNGDATITNYQPALDDKSDGWFWQSPPLQVGTNYQVEVDATVTSGSLGVLGSFHNTPAPTTLLPGAGRVQFTATAASERIIFYATPGSTITIHNVNIGYFASAGGSKGLFHNSNFADPEDGTSTNWQHYAGWTVIGNGRAVLDTNNAPGNNGQFYLYQRVGNLDTTKQYRLRIQGQLNAGASIALHDYGLVGIGQDLVFTPHSDNELFIIEGSGAGYLSNVILALDDANFPT